MDISARLEGFLRYHECKAHDHSHVRVEILHSGHVNHFAAAPTDGAELHLWDEEGPVMAESQRQEIGGSGSLTNRYFEAPVVGAQIQNIVSVFVR